MRTRNVVLLALLAFASGIIAAADWRPVDPSELAQKTPRVDAAADAEAIFWDVRIEDSFANGELTLTLYHYIRIKIFTDLGRQKYASVEIPRLGKRSITDVAGRTIKPDGNIFELTKDAIFDRELVKTKGLKLKGKSFTLPNAAVGDIIEYQYREVRKNEIASHMRLYFQRELPMWSVTYHLKPLRVPWLPYAMRSMPFQCDLPPFQKEPNGFYATSMSKVPAFQEEPNMPPEDQLRAWMLIYYEEDKKLDVEKYWKDLGRRDFEQYKPLMNANNAVKQRAAELTSGAATPELKLAALETFCRTQIKNLGSGAFQMTASERKAVKENNSPGNTLKQGAGWGIDVNLLFAALANAAGFDARMARVPDRGDIFFTKAWPTTYFLEGFSVAVMLGDQWTFFDPSTPYLQPGMLRWQEEGQMALISDLKEGFFARTHYTQASRSVRRRRADFKLLQDGTLEGTLEYAYKGHVARDHKLRYEEMTPAQQEEDWKERLQSRLSGAEISGFEAQDTGDPEKPVIVRHKITVPAYATRTGKRILLQPAFFQRNVQPRFTDNNRKWDLYFEYGWAEDDQVVIELPQGWELDAPLTPVSTNLGGVGSYDVALRKTTDGRRLIYSRRFEWGRENKILIPAAMYPQVKKIFEFVQQQDNFTIALKAAGNAQ